MFIALDNFQPIASHLIISLFVCLFVKKKKKPSCAFFVSSLYQVVKSGSSETRVEKRIVITADSDVDQDKVRTPTTVSTQREDFSFVAEQLTAMTWF